MPDWKPNDKVGHFVDISQWQDPDVVRWGEYAEKHPFVVLRASFGGGEKDLDSAFKNHFTSAREKGVEVIGAYHFAYPTGGDARDEARNFVRRCREGGMRCRGRRDLVAARNEVFVLDYERHTQGLNDDAWVVNFKDEFKELTRANDGQSPRLCIYGYGGPLNQLSGPHGMPVWFAAYVNDWRPWWPAGWDNPDTEAKRPFAWQHTNGQDGPTPHRLAGFKVNTDVNRGLSDLTVGQLKEIAS